jgi:hypothetical protein
MQATMKTPKWNIVIASVACLLLGTTALHAYTLPQLWPTFSQPSTLVNVGLAGQTSNDLMAIFSFQGAYNQRQLSSRLYVNADADANYWLAHAMPSTITVSQLSYTQSDPDGTLKALLSTYGSSIAGYYICDPYNAPESCNMASTLAGINDAMVVTVDNLAIMQNATFNPSVPLMTNGDLRTYSVPTSGEYTWIGSNSSLVNSTAMNMISNPSGSGGTTGWSVSGGTVSTGAGTGTCSGQGTTLKYVSTAANTWAFSDPAIPSNRVNTTPYIFSVQACVQSGSPVFLDAWNGCGDVQSGTVSSGSGWQTLQLAVSTPVSGCTGNTTIKLEVRTSGSSGTTVFFENAAVIDDRVAIDTYQFNNLAASTSSTILAQDNAGNANLRDYQIAAKMFVFDLSSQYADEKTLYGQIINHTASNTPIMGYIDGQFEAPDVLFLSGSGEGHFLNASDDYNNGSVWASMPQATSLSQPGPTAPFKTSNGTVYMAFAASDGDNVSIVEHQNVQRWTANQFLGAVPMAWTVSPGMINFAPGLLSNFYEFLPQSQEIMAGPSGIGYGTGEETSDLMNFATLTNQFMTAESMSSVTSWESSTVMGGLSTFASKVNVPHVVYRNPQALTIETNTAATVLDGQDAFYNSNPPDQVAAIETALATGGSAPYQSGSPNFLEFLIDNLTMSPDDTLYIAQKLQRDLTYPIVFMTPAELAQAERGGGTVVSSPQAVLASTLQTAFPQNFIWNANGEEPHANTTSSSWALGNSGSTCANEALYSNQDFLASSNNEYHVPAGNTATCYIQESLAATGDASPVMVAGRYYLFTVNVAGTGTAYLNVFDGTSNHQSPSVTLSSTSWTPISMVVQMQSATAGNVQVQLAPSASSGQTVYFGGISGNQPGWYYGTSQGSGTSSPMTFGAGTYASGQGNTQAFVLGNPANDGTQWIDFYPTGLTSGTTYVGSVDVAGTGQAYLAFYNGSTGTNSSTVTLSNNWQTLTVSAAASGSNPPRVQVVAPSSTSAQTVYFRNASLTPAPANTPLFTTGVETGQVQLAATNTVDTLSGSGGSNNVTSAILQATTTASHGGSDAVQYGGTASGGTTTDAYMEGFANSSTLNSTSRLSYWIYPMTPMGSESGASSMTGLNSTCVAIDIVFTNGTALHNLGVKDQFSNPLTPAGECNHLQPDQWNYVTASLSGLSGLTVDHIDVGYSQNGASGNYGGYIDDVTLSH